VTAIATRKESPGTSFSGIEALSLPDAATAARCCKTVMAGRRRRTRSSMTAVMDGRRCRNDAAQARTGAVGGRSRPRDLEPQI